MSARKPRASGITTEQITKPSADVQRDLDLDRDPGCATALAQHLYTALVHLVAWKLGSRWPDDPSIREAITDPDIAPVWRLYREAIDEAKDHDAGRNRLSRRFHRMGTRAPHWEQMTVVWMSYAVIRLRPRYAEHTDLADLVAAIWRDHGRPADVDE